MSDDVVQRPIAPVDVDYFLPSVDESSSRADTGLTPCVGNADLADEESPIPLSCLIAGLLVCAMFSPDPAAIRPTARIATQIFGFGPAQEASTAGSAGPLTEVGLPC